MGKRQKSANWADPGGAARIQKEFEARVQKRKRRGSRGRKRIRRARIGRPPKKSLELARGLASRIRQGQSYASAAMSEGIARSTFYKWLEEGQVEGADGEAQAFSDILARAKGDAIGRAERIAYRGGKGTWSKVRWLESQHREEWEPTTKAKVEHTGEVTLMFEDLPASEVVEKAAARAKAAKRHADL